mgnify:FL=1
MKRNKKPLRVAAYCRVSTDKEAQEGSYEGQMAYYRSFITGDPRMRLVGLYGDKGKSGLSAKKRSGLQRLMEDCRAGKIDLILTKSISRFARNMSDCAELMRELRGLGVQVLFEKEGLHSMCDNAALMLHILSAIAQEESQSISQHTARAHEQYALEGRPFGRVAYGYRNAGDNRWEINEGEASKVRRAFDLAGAGNSYQEILKALNTMEEGPVWRQKRLKRMLTNPVYKGDYVTNQTVSLVPGKQVVNKNYRDRIYIREHHEPIVSPEEFEAVQRLISLGALRSNRKREAVPNGQSNEN